ncbi:hypothetical protein [Agrobacterium tumefaciens]|uniref:hypothetical protein n=1 Tax=Agrobacterium tumefaciens TaxID=358 RepID=UPI003BA1DB36
MDDSLQGFLLLWALISIVIVVVTMVRQQEWNGLVKEETKLLQQLTDIEAEIAQTNRQIADLQVTRKQIR